MVCSPILRLTTNCKGRGPDLDRSNININDVLGGYSLSLIDSLDTLYIMGNYSEFRRGIELVTKNVHFDLDTIVHVFESTIRVLGGLISAYQLNSYSPDKLLTLAQNLASKLLHAFNSTTQIPYPAISLIDSKINKNRTGIPPGAVGGILLEFTTLSKLTNDPVYEDAARQSVASLYDKRTVKGLFGSEIDVETGHWMLDMAGVGAGTDSLYECVLKNYIAYGNLTDLAMYQSMMLAVEKHLKPKNACFPYLNIHSREGYQLNNWVDSLSAFFPGMLVLEGNDINQAICMHAHYWSIFQSYGGMPERYNWYYDKVELGWYPLRPEFIESTYYLYRATKSPFYLNIGEQIITILEERTKSNCGYGTIHDVTKHSLEDRQESFFLSETLKYLYLLFDENNFLHKSNEWVFTTQAHLVKIENEHSNEMKLGRFSKSIKNLMNQTSTYRCNDNSRFSDISNCKQSILGLLNKDSLPTSLYRD